MHIIKHLPHRLRKQTSTVQEYLTKGRNYVGTRNLCIIKVIKNDVRNFGFRPWSASYFDIII